ncbi:hypothetical protein ACM66B_002277 [Microbotryomycetes sp. NB124-2]
MLPPVLSTIDCCGLTETHTMVLLPLQLVRSALDKAGLLGTPYVPRDFHPSVLLQVEFPQTGASVQLGNELEPSQGQGDPVVSFVPADLDQQQQADTNFCLVSFDPDAPSRENQEFGPWRHYVIGGLQPKSLDQIEASASSSSDERSSATQSLVQQTQEPISPWVAPSPGKGTGLHRYCFALYKESEPLKPLSEQSTIKSNERPDRRKFDVAAFAKDNNLELVGFNFFLPRKVVSRRKQEYTLWDRVDIWAQGMGLAVLEPWEKLLLLFVAVMMSALLYFAVVRWLPRRVDKFVERASFYVSGH